MPARTAGPHRVSILRGSSSCRGLRDTEADDCSPRQPPSLSRLGPSLRLSASAAALLRVLRAPRLLSVELAYLAFIAAEYGTWVAVLVYAYGATGPESVGPVAVIQLVPAAIVAPFAATLGQRVARDRALALSYALLAVLMILTGIAMASGAPAPAVYAAAIAAQAALTTVRPIQAAILPALVGTAGQLTSANAVTMIVEGVGQLAGPLAAGVLLALSGPAAPFLLAGIGCALAALLVAGVLLTHITGAIPAAEGPRRGAAAGGTVRVEVEVAIGDAEAVRARARASARSGRRGSLDGVRSVWGSAGGRAVVVLLGVRQVTGGAMDVVLVVAAIQLLGMGQGGAGYLNAALGLGAVLGGAATLLLAGRRLAPYLVVGAIAWAVFLVLVASGPQPGVAIALLAGAGIGLAVLDVSARTLLQRLMPSEVLAGAFGVVEGFSFAGLAVGAFVAGPIIQLGGVSGALVVAGLGLPIVAALVLRTVHLRERRIRLPHAEIELLRGLPLFAPSPAPQIEWVARRLVPVSFPAGALVIKEGDIGDRFYVIRTGQVQVSRAGAELAVFGPGSSFGEVALLRRVPRTATVVALTPVDLYALERDDFIVAVTGTIEGLDEAMRITDDYLAAMPAPG